MNKKCERFNSCCWSSLLWDRLYFVFCLSGCILSHYLEIESCLIFPPLASWKSKGKEGERRRTFVGHPLYPWCLAHPILPLPMLVSWKQPGGGSPFCRNWLGEADTPSWVTVGPGLAAVRHTTEARTSLPSFCFPFGNLAPSFDNFLTYYLDCHSPNCHFPPTVKKSGGLPWFFAWFSFSDTP